MPRFVILQHDAPQGLHWDFMLETGGSLATWALAAPPDSPQIVAADSLADHRLAYLDYEGPVSGGRGSVKRWDAGTYQPERRDAAEVVVALHGTRLIGKATLRRSADRPGGWQFSFAPL